MSTISRKPLAPGAGSISYGSMSPGTSTFASPPSRAGSVTSSIVSLPGPPVYTMPNNQLPSPRNTVSPASSDASLPPSVSQMGVFEIGSIVPETSTTTALASTRPQKSGVGGLARLCNACSQGIPYDVHYSHCLFCQISLCTSCTDRHRCSLNTSILRVVSKTLPGNQHVPEYKICMTCSQTAVHHCQDCRTSYCRDCFQGNGSQHRHQSFMTFEAPFHSIKSAGEISTVTCCNKPAISHCTQCLKDMHLKQHVLRCKSCIVTAGQSISVCEQCFPEAWARHDQAHVAISVLFQSVADDVQKGYSCTQCSFRSNGLDITVLTQHSHNTYIHSIGAEEREALVNSTYRDCQRKRARDDQAEVMRCSRCKNDFPTGSIRMCVGGTCSGNFCNHCFPQASVNHIHGPHMFRSTTDTARPDIGFLPEGWSALQNKEGKIYYFHDGSKQFTFTKPPLPKYMPPGWTIAYDAQGKTMYVDPDTRIATYVNPLYGIAPLGWESRQTDAGRLFYVSCQDGLMTWHKPLAVEQLPAGWEAGKTADGKVYYINHVTKSNTWVKPSMPANVTNSATLPTRSSLPSPTLQSPTVPQTSHHVSPNPQSQTSPRGSLVPTLQNAGLPNQQGAYMSQPTQAGYGMGLNPRAEYQVNQTVASPQPPSLAHSRLPSTTLQPGPTSPQYSTAPPLQRGTTTNIPISTSTLPQQPQSIPPLSPGFAPTASRPTLQSRIVSAPATTNAASAGSTVGTKFKNSMNTLKQNPGWKKAALGVGAIGTMAVKAALMDDYGSGDSADYAIEDSTTVVDGNAPPVYEQQSDAFPTQSDYTTQQQDPAALEAQLMLEQEGQLNAVALI